MLLKKIKIIASLIVIATFSSCLDEEDITGDFIKDYHTDVKYTIEGQITTTPSKQHVIITSIGIKNDPTKNVGISGATVKVTDGTHTWNYTELPKSSPKYSAMIDGKIGAGVYESNRYFAGKENVTYTLTVTIKGKTYTAKQTMPVADDINSQEFNALINTAKEEVHIFGMGKSAIWEVDETPKDEIFIYLTERVAHSTKNTHNRIRITNPLPVTEPGYFIQPPSGYDYRILRRYTVTKEYEKYMWSVLSEMSISGFEDVEPSSLASNFNDKEISGYFSAVSCKEYNANKTSYLPRNLTVFNTQKQYKAQYTTEGEVKLILKPTGECELQGLGKKLIGAYEVADNKEILVYFTNKYTNVDANLYDFYIKKLKKKSSWFAPTGEVIRSAMNAVFTIKNTTTVQSEDDVIWNLQ